MADDIKLVVDSSDLQRAVDFLDKMGIQTARLSTKTQTLQQKFNKYTSEVDRLSKKYKPLYAASKQYESALEEINRAQKLGVLNDQQRSGVNHGCPGQSACCTQDCAASGRQSNALPFQCSVCRTEGCST